MNYERPYYEDLNYRPLLFYVIFGVKDEELTVSRERHQVDAFPDGLEFMMYNKSEHSEYMSSMLGGTLGEVLDERNHDLYEAVCNTDRWAVIRGEVQQDEDLHYMRNAIGFVQALVESGAVGVLDLQTFNLYTAQEWTDHIFMPEFHPYAHVDVLVSETEDGACWVHTRGMRKFGRPDIGVEGVLKGELDNAVEVVQQLLYYGVLGAFFSRPVKLHTNSERTYIVRPGFVEDFDNPDYNNSYYRISWADCELVSE